MSTDKDLELRVAEEYGKAFAILDTLYQLTEKLKEDPSKKTPKMRTTLTDNKLYLTAAFEGVSALRSDVDTLLERGVLIGKDTNSIDQALKRLGTLRTRLEAEDISKADCTKWLEDLESIKTALEKRYQIKRVDSERQASVSSLTEQLKQRDLQIEQLNQVLQQKDAAIQQLQNAPRAQSPEAKV